MKTLTRRIVLVEPDGTSVKGVPMVLVRLDCDHHFRSRAEKAPRPGERRDCRRCRTEVRP